MRCVGVLTSIDYGITRGTRRLMAYYYQPREGIGDEVVADRYRRIISGRLRGELDGSTLPTLLPTLPPASSSYTEVCFIQIVIAHLRQQSGFREITAGSTDVCNHARTAIMSRGLPAIPRASGKGKKREMRGSSMGVFIETCV